MSISPRTGRRLLTWALVAVLLPALILAGTSRDVAGEAVAPVTMDQGRGIAMGGPWTWLPEAQQRDDLDRIAAAGAGWIRVSFRWSSMQPGPDRYDWTVHDRIVRMAHERGLSVVANVAYTPRWARPDDCDHPHCAPASADTYAAFIETAVGRYASYGVRAWEMWNEPNLGGFWRPRPDPEAYAALLIAAAAAARRADPAVTVVSGGLGPRGEDSTGNLTPATFLRRLYAAGAGAALDAVGIHPYSFPRSPLDPHPTNTFAALPDLHALMASHGDAHKQLWITEFGYWTSPLGVLHLGGSVTESQQAQYLTEAMEAAAGESFIGPVLWYALHDTGDGELVGLEREHNFGLIRRDGTAKPAFAAFRTTPPPERVSDDCARRCVDTALGIRTAVGPRRLRVTTRLQPAAGGERVRVVLSRKTQRTWKRLGSRSGAVGDDGRYRARFQRRSSGTCRVKAVFAGSAAHRPSHHTLRLRC